MSYATSSPAATTGGQGNTPVSLFFLTVNSLSAYLTRGGWCRSPTCCIPFFLLSAEGQAWRSGCPVFFSPFIPLSLPTVNLSDLIWHPLPAHFPLSPYHPISISISIFYLSRPPIITISTHPPRQHPSLYTPLLAPLIQEESFLCFLKWPRPLLTKNVPNCSPCARIAGRQPLPSGAEMSWAPFSATHAVSF